MAKVELSDHVCDVVFALFDCDGEWGPLESGGRTQPTALGGDTVWNGALQTAARSSPHLFSLLLPHIDGSALSIMTLRNITPPS